MKRNKREDDNVVFHQLLNKNIDREAAALQQLQKLKDPFVVSISLDVSVHLLAPLPCLRREKRTFCGLTTEGYYGSWIAHVDSMLPEVEVRDAPGDKV